MAFKKKLKEHFRDNTHALKKRLKRIMKSTPWLFSLINVALTAGPITYLGLLGGSYIGYGKIPETKTFIYFGVYTGIAGILAGVIQACRHLIFIPRAERNELIRTETINRLFMLYFSARNAYLNNYPEEERPIIASWWSLRSAASHENRLEEAVFDITGDAALARAMKRIEYYNRQGFTDVMRREYLRHESYIETEYQKISARFPGMASHFLDRFRGNAPTLERGQPRPAGFIERLNSVEERNDTSYAAPEDSIAAIHLGLEFMLGRSILILDPQFNGHRRLERAKDKLDTLISDYRLSYRRRNSRMRALIADLIVNNNHDVSTLGADGITLKNMLIQTIIDAPASILSDPTIHARYERIYQLNAGVKRLQKRLARQEDAYNTIWESEGKAFAEDIAASVPGTQRAALTIEEIEISPNRKQYLAITRQLHTLTDNFIIRPDTLRAYHSLDDASLRADDEDFIRLACDIINILDEYLNISEPDIHTGVEESNEADFGFVQPGMPPAIKQSHGEAAVREIQQDRSRTAVRLAKRLSGYFNVPLGENVIEYLALRYKAPQDELTAMADYAEHRNMAPSLAEEVFVLPTTEKIFRIKPQQRYMKGAALLKKKNT